MLGERRLEEVRFSPTSVTHFTTQGSPGALTPLQEMNKNICLENNALSWFCVMRFRLKGVSSIIEVFPLHPKVVTGKQDAIVRARSNPNQDAIVRARSSI